MNWKTWTGNIFVRILVAVVLAWFLIALIIPFLAGLVAMDGSLIKIIDYIIVFGAIIYIIAGGPVA